MIRLYFNETICSNTQHRLKGGQFVVEVILHPPLLR